MSDLALARRVLDGDAAAAEELFDEYFPRLFRFARTRLNGNDDAAEDVVQATLVQGVRKLHTFRGEAALFTWLCAICRHEIGAWLARAGRAAEVALMEDHADVRLALEAVAGLAAIHPEREAERRELARLVHATLDHVPASYARALEWRYLEGLSVDEIAGRLGVGYKAAESLLSRARGAFRDAFALLAGGPGHATRLLAEDA